MLDAGHGGTRNGAIGCGGIKEKNVTLDIARRTRATLEQAGYKVYMTRTNDRDVSLLERSQYAVDIDVDLFVSIHANSCPGSKNATGIETWTPNLSASIEPYNKRGSNTNGFWLGKKRDTDQCAPIMDGITQQRRVFSKDLAQHIQKGIHRTLQTNKFPMVDRGVKEASFLVLVRGIAPSVLVEVGFVTNELESSRLGRGAYRK